MTVVSKAGFGTRNKQDASERPRGSCACALFLPFALLNSELPWLHVHNSAFVYLHFTWKGDAMVEALSSLAPPALPNLDRLSEKWRVFFSPRALIICRCSMAKTFGDRDHEYVDLQGDLSSSFDRPRGSRSEVKKSEAKETKARQVNHPAAFARA